MWRRGMIIINKHLVWTWEDVTKHYLTINNGLFFLWQNSLSHRRGEYFSLGLLQKPFFKKFDRKKNFTTYQFSLSVWKWKIINMSIDFIVQFKREVYVEYTGSIFHLFHRLASLTNSARMYMSFNLNIILARFVAHEYVAH